MSSSKFVDDDRFDGLYMNVADAARGIEPLLDTVFSFLRRKTDFFAGPPGAANGTEAAMAKVNAVLQKHADLYATEHPKKKAGNTPSASKKAKKEETVLEIGADGGFDLTSATPPPTPAAAAAKAVRKKETSPDKPPAQAQVEAVPKEAPPENQQEATKASDTAAAAPGVDADEKDKEGKGVAPNSGNGGTVEGKYVWTQILAEVSVTIALPDNTRGRDLNVVISRKHLKVGLKTPWATTWLVDDDLI
jgi:hypothetical protein